MTSSIGAPNRFGTALVIDPLRANSAWIIVLGVIYAIAGVIALASVVTATVVSVFVVGIMMVVACVAQVINAFQVKTWGRFVLWVLLGALYIVAGFVTLENPLLAAAILSLVLGVALIASGIMRIILAFSVKEGMAWMWIVVSGGITLLLGSMIFDALAHLQPLFSRAIPRHRSRLCWNRLDRSRLGLTTARHAVICGQALIKSQRDNWADHWRARVFGPHNPCSERHHLVLARL
jgi:uncharacterized membrane protein HdeD (DUF308 family)